MDSMKIRMIERKYQESNQDLYDRLVVEAKHRQIAERERDEYKRIAMKSV